MANIKSQIKRVKTNAARTERNRAYKSELRTWIRKVRTAADAGDTELRRRAAELYGIGRPPAPANAREAEAEAVAVTEAVAEAADAPQ